MASQNWLVLFSLTRLHFVLKEKILIENLYHLISVAFAIV